MKDGEIKNKLSPAQVSVMRHRVTEPPYFGKYWDHFDAGTYRCAACDTNLFSSNEKFDSKTGWPSFRKPLNERDLQFKSEPGPDDKVEIRCKKCKSHLGYVIAGDAPYYRINSVCLVFEATPTPVVAAPVKSENKESVARAKESAPTHSVLNAVEHEGETITWNIRSIVAGTIVGLIIGSFATGQYLSPTAAGVAPETASTTAASASTTPVEPTTTKKTVDTPVPAPKTGEEVAPPPSETATTTQ